MAKYDDIYSFIKTSESDYQKPVRLDDGWNWSMKEHLRRSYLYKNFQFYEENENRTLRPFNNIILSLLNIQYRTEGFDVKDIEIYVNDKDDYYKSFLVKKYHDKWALENHIDTFIDELVASYVDYGGVLIRDTAANRPEVVDLRSLVFCNQTDILAYPFCIKHLYTPAKLREMDTWGKEGATVETLITLCKDEDAIEIYELIGTMPGQWLDRSKKDVQQIQVVAFYKKENGDEQGVTLFKKRLPKLPFKFLSRDVITGRAIGRGGIEELFESQQWTNWSDIKVTEMLEAASKMIAWTDDPTLSAKHPSGMKDMENLEFLELQSGKRAGIFDTYPRNLAAFTNRMDRLEERARLLSAASEGLLGESPSSGTPFKLYEAQNIEARGMHRYRQGQVAVFMDDIYRDWVLPHVAKEIANDQHFLADLSSDEMQSISDNMAIKETNRAKIQRVLNMRDDEIIGSNEFEAIGRSTKESFMKAGNKRFIDILKNEIKKPLAVFTNIAGKQKNLALLTDKLVNILRQFISTPQIRQDPEMAKLLNVILESSGMSPIMFGASPLMQAPPGSAGGTESLKQLGGIAAQADKAAMTIDR